MKDYTLVVIDMQSYFTSAHNRKTLKSVKSLISQAMKDRQPIILVEYSDCGSSMPSLYRLTEHYSYLYVIRKQQDDGSAEISRLIRGMKLPATNIKVCGVNTDCCVYESVMGLKRRMRNTNFEIVENACWSTYDHNGAINEFKNTKNVMVV